MRIKSQRKDAVSPVIAVILMVAITVVLAGVLYVWVTSLSSSDENFVEAYTLELYDNDYNKDNRGDVFQVGEPLVTLDQIAGEPIDWNGHKIYMEEKSAEIRIEVAISKIAGQPYDPINNSKSEVGDYIVISALSTDFKSGDWIKLIVVEGSHQKYSDSSYTVIY